ncbi:MAG TPA: MBL fold metallo-hydrolase [Terriglobales bacterium]|nr:MBL fold metallo-hydrolase [Terriglobales bacterium]
MYFQQFYLGCLAHASYMLASEGTAIIVDPQRDVEIYLRAADERGFQIKHIFETHLHADFVSGHRELAARTGAQVYLSRLAGARFPHVPVDDGFELQFGNCHIRTLATPGHTPESICLLVIDPEKSVNPWAVLTGDTLFIGDVGRPDLSPTHTPQQLAGMLFDSLHQKLLTLPDEVLVYPAHGAGSLCGRNMRAERYSTIGTERLTNYALQIRTKEEFIQQLTTNLPVRPEYFAHDAEINREGAPPLNDLPPLRSLNASELQQIIEDDSAVVLDVRESADFAAAYVPGSINIGLSGQFASWAATILGLDTPIVLLAQSVDQVNEARIRLARVGIETMTGYLEGGLATWTASGLSTSTIGRISPSELSSAIRSGDVQVLDVRRQGEWDSGHLDVAYFRPLDLFYSGLPELDPTKPVAVHCKSGYRSMIAASLLKKAGFSEVVDVIGGFDAWEKQNLPISTAAAAS